MSLNVNAKAWVPGGASPAPAMSTPAAFVPAVVDPMTPMPNAAAAAFVPRAAPVDSSVLFRYSLVPSPGSRFGAPLAPQLPAPAAPVATTTDGAAPQAAIGAAPASAVYLSHLLTTGVLRSSPQGGKSVEALRAFLANHFEAQTDHQMSDARPLSSPVGFLLLRDVVSQGTTVQSPADTAPGFLLPLLVPATAMGDPTSLLPPAFDQLLEAFQTDLRVRGFGHIVKRVRSDDGAVLHNHFFFVLSAPLPYADASLVPLSASQIIERVQLARRVVATPRILSLVFDAIPVVAAVGLCDGSPGLKEIPATALLPAGVRTVSGPPAIGSGGGSGGPSPVVVVDVPPSIADLPAVAEALERDVLARLATTPAGATVAVLLAVPCLPGARHGDALRVLVRLCLDHMIYPKFVLLSDGASAKFKPLSKERTTVNWATLSPAVATAHCFVPASVTHPSDVLGFPAAFRPLLAAVAEATATTAVAAMPPLSPPTEAADRKLSATSAPFVAPSIASVRPALHTVLSLPPERCGSPFVGTSFSPVDDLDLYASLLDQLAPVRPYQLPGGAAHVTRLSRTAYADAAQHVAHTTYRARRRHDGTPVLLVIDSVRNMYLADASGFGSNYGCGNNSNNCASGAPSSPTSASAPPLATPAPRFSFVVQIPMCWSGILNATHCVLEASLVPSFRGDAQWKVLVEDALMWNGTVFGNQAPSATPTLSQRLADLDGPGLEDEHNWASASPQGIVVLRSIYVPVEKGTSLLHGPLSEHGSCGLVLVPLAVFAAPATTASDPLPVYTWAPAESIHVTFAASAVREIAVSSDAPTGSNGAPVVVRQATLACRVSETNPARVSFHDEFVDFFPSVAPGLTDGAVFSCMLRRELDGAHWWDVLREYSDAERAVPATLAEIDALVSDPPVVAEDLLWLFSAHSYLCAGCKVVSDRGQVDPSVNKYFCGRCWERYGFGTCRQCSAPFARGSLDQPTQTFYCDGCWAVFMQSSGGSGGAPASAGSSFGGQASSPHGAAGKGGAINHNSKGATTGAATTNTNTNNNAGSAVTAGGPPPIAAPRPVAAPIGIDGDATTSPLQAAAAALAPPAPVAVKADGAPAGEADLCLGHCKAELLRAVTLTAPHRDVLHLCCGSGAGARAWIQHGCRAYLGVDARARLIADAAHNRDAILAELRRSLGGEAAASPATPPSGQTNSSSSGNGATAIAFPAADPQQGSAAAAGAHAAALPHIEFLCADCFSPEFWRTHLANAHAGQVHVIDAKQGFHHAFFSAAVDASAAADAAALQRGVAETLRGVARALVPNGVFFGAALQLAAVERLVASTAAATPDGGGANAAAPTLFQNEFFSLELVRSVGVAVEGATATPGVTVARISTTALPAVEECVVDATALEVAARAAGLDPVDGLWSVPLLSLLRSGPATGLTAAVKPTTTAKPWGGRALTAAEAAYAELYHCFALRKSASISPVLKPTAAPDPPSIV